VSEITCFYRQPSLTSDLGRHRDLSPGLPADPETLSAVVRGLVVHNFTAKVQGLSFPAGSSAKWYSRLAATAQSAETLKECFDLYPELQPPADAVAIETPG
jgi:hypothetical protein